MTLRELHLFAGIGGGILGGMLLGHRCVGAVDLDPYCRRVLEARQRDGILEPFPIHDDIRTFDGTAWRGRVDVVAGGFPCQDISDAGKRAGLDGERSSLWWQMHRVVREVGPSYVFVENVAALLVRGFDRVLGSLADLGFDAEWVVRSAADLGATHLRRRVWLLARHADAWSISNTNGKSQHAVAIDAQVAGASQSVGDADGARLAQREGERGNASEGQPTIARTGWWVAEPRVGRVAHGVPARVQRLHALGNAQVPIVAASAFTELMDRFQ